MACHMQKRYMLQQFNGIKNRLDRMVCQRNRGKQLANIGHPLVNGFFAVQPHVEACSCARCMAHTFASESRMGSTDSVFVVRGLIELAWETQMKNHWFGSGLGEGF